MKEYTVNVAVRVWIETTIRAETEEKARAKALEQAWQLMKSNGFSLVDGKVEILGSMNSSLLDKIPV